MRAMTVEPPRLADMDRSERTTSEFEGTYFEFLVLLSLLLLHLGLLALCSDPFLFLIGALGLFLSRHHLFLAALVFSSMVT